MNLIFKKRYALRNAILKNEQIFIAKLANSVVP